MEKVQVLSVKPICTEKDDGIYSSSHSITTTSDSDVKRINPMNEILYPSKNIPHSNDIVAVRNISNYASSRKDKSNLSFKNAFSRASIKNQVVLSNGDKYNSSKNGLLLSSNCFGRSDVNRTSYNERINSGLNLQQSSVRGKKIANEASEDFVYLTANSVIGRGLYRSNSSLEIEHDTQHETAPVTQYFRREYGSHGSINISSTQQDALKAVFQNFQQNSQVHSTTDSTSPKVRSKISRLWERDRPSILKKLLPNKGLDPKEDKIEVSSDYCSNSTDVIGNCNTKVVNMDLENSKENITLPKLIRRPAIAHYDCRSLAAQMNPSRLKALLADRSNTTTGASAAAMADSSSQSISGQSSSEDLCSLTENRASRCNHMVST